MKNNIASLIMLTAGAIAAICCIVQKVSLDRTLIVVLLTLFIFMIIGFIAQKLIQSMNHDVEERAKLEEEKRKEEEIRLQQEQEQKEAEEGQAEEGQLEEKQEAQV